MPFLQLPCLIPVDESGPRTLWLTHEPFAFKSEWTGKTYVVPARYLSDLASVPRAPFAYWHFGGRANAASCLHDFLYEEGMRLGLIESREEADWVYLEAMLSTGVEPNMAHQIYFTVKDYGESHFTQIGERNVRNQIPSRLWLETS